MVNTFFKAYCIFCKSGSETVIARRINEMDSKILAIAPVRILQERYKKKWIERERLLIPGYVFFYAEKDITFRELIKISGAYKFLEYETGSKELVGADYNYALWIYNNNGRIEPSKMLSEGDSVKIIEGPLKDGFGKIIRIDRHKRRAWVEFDFYGNLRKVSLSIVDIELEDS